MSDNSIILLGYIMILCEVQPGTKGWTDKFQSPTSFDHALSARFNPMTTDYDLISIGNVIIDSFRTANMDCLM